MKPIYYSLQGLLLLFIDKRDDFLDKNEELYSRNIKNILTIIISMPHQIFIPIFRISIAPRDAFSLTLQLLLLV